MSATPRPVRNLAAWGYESDSSGDRIEVDVWTVNRREGPEDPFPDPGDFDAPVVEVLALAGDVAKVRYRGIDTIGYRRVSTDVEVSQQAFAGAARASGAERTEAGTFREGADPIVLGPDLDAVIRHGEQEVIPVVRREFMELGDRIEREPHRDEDEEAVEVAPIDGFDHVIRVFTRGTTFRYRVDGGGIRRA